MAAVTLQNMDVEALLALRADVEKALTERSRDLQRQLGLLGGAVGKKRGRPAGGAVRASALKGTKVPPKYRGPGGETWAGRGAMPRWLAALVREGHSVEEFSIGRKGGKRAAAAAKKVVKSKRTAQKPVTRKRRQPSNERGEEAQA